jgi:hypothetical protein
MFQISRAIEVAGFDGIYPSWLLVGGGKKGARLRGAGVARVEISSVCPNPLLHLLYPHHMKLFSFPTINHLRV